MNTLLIVGFGDIARRAAASLQAHFAIVAMVRHLDAAAPIPGVRLVAGDLDQPASLAPFAGCASHILHCAPPPRIGATDPRTANLLAVLAGHPRLPQRLVYVSTSGVYGDCAGAWVDEKRPVNPQSERARRRVDAEQALARFARSRGVRTVVLRAPGIYAADRLPLARLRAGIPVLCPEEDVYTNHVHANDLAAMVTAALVDPAAEGIYNACDDRALAMGEWFDLLADRAGLARPPRISRSAAPGRIPASLLSFASESRRLMNARIKRELGIRLRYPSVYEGVPGAIANAR